MTEQLYFSATTGFEAACRIPLLPAGHRSRRLHGHSYLADVRCQVPAGWATFAGSETGQLRQALTDAVAPLDYSDLNTHLDQPTDENLARWLRSRLAVALPGPLQIGVESTVHSGVDLDESDHAHIWRRYRFESAHQLPHVPPGHKCGRMHGHGFEVILHADQDLADRQMGIDYDRIDALWAPLHAQLDHACLNDIPGLENPTSEMIAGWLWQRLKPALPELSWVTVYETGSCGAHFDGRHYRIWKDMTLDSAVRLTAAPEGDPRRRIHGHTYALRLHLSAPLDTVLGWTLDFGEVKARFDPLFRALDHHPLHELPGAGQADPASLARWIRSQAEPLLPQLNRIDLHETRGCGVALCWGKTGPALPA